MENSSSRSGRLFGHTYRFHNDPNPKLTTYKVFYDAEGNPIRTAAETSAAGLTHGTSISPRPTLPRAATAVPTQRQDFDDTYGLHQTNARFPGFFASGSGNVAGGGTGGSPLRPWTTTRIPGPAGTIRTGSMHSSIQPRPYKYLLTEYNDEYRGPEVRVWGVRA